MPRTSRRSGVHGSPGSHPSSRSSAWNEPSNRASTSASPCGRTPRSAWFTSATICCPSSSSWRAPGAHARRSTEGLSSRPIARSWPRRLQVRTALAVASAPNDQCQPRSPGCSCSGAPSCCHSRSTRTASPSPSTFGVLNTIDTTRIKPGSPSMLNPYADVPCSNARRRTAAETLSQLPTVCRALRAPRSSFRRSARPPLGHPPSLRSSPCPPHVAR